MHLDLVIINQVNRIQRNLQRKLHRVGHREEVLSKKKTI